jgi:hypothetical protein
MDASKRCALLHKFADLVERDKIYLAVSLDMKLSRDI